MQDRPAKAQSFVNTKTSEGGVFTGGGKGDNFRVWCKNAKTLCTAQTKGFKRALEQAEKQERTVDVHDL